MYRPGGRSPHSDRFYKVAALAAVPTLLTADRPAVRSSLAPETLGEHRICGNTTSAMSGTRFGRA